MDLRAQRVDAIVLRAVAFGEADVVLHLLSRARGRLSVFARGARKSRKLGACIEPFSRVEALLAERPGAELWTLREASLTESHLGLRDDLHRLAHAGWAVELAHDLSRPNEPAEALFDALAQFLARLSKSTATSARLRALELSLLAAGGLAPELQRCARCGGEVARGRAPFDPRAGGIVCASCAAPGTLAISPGVRALCDQLLQRGLEAADSPLSADGSGRAADPAAFERCALEAGEALGRFLAFHLGHAPRSLEFLAQVGAPQ